MGLTSPSIQLTDDQQTAIDSIHEWRKAPGNRQIFILAGLAGTGKTTIIKNLTLPKPAIVAFTGKAVNVLRKKGLYNAQTIHSLIYEFNPHNHSWSRRPHIDCDTIIIDEASMLSKDMLLDLKSYGKPMLAVGDHGQLEPVGDDPGLMRKPHYTLTHIHRQAAASPIIKIAYQMRMGDHPEYAINSNPDPTIAITDWDTIIEKSRTFNQILCCFNGQRTKLNDQIRQHRGLVDLTPGEKLICLRNDYNFGIFNGQQALVLDPDTIKMDDGQEIPLRRLDYNTLETGTPPKFGQQSSKIHFTYGHAITVHKAQGSEWDKVAIISGYTPNWDMGRWNYTAVTRAAEKFVWV